MKTTRRGFLGGLLAAPFAAKAACAVPDTTVGLAHTPEAPVSYTVWTRSASSTVWYMSSDSTDGMTGTING